MSDAYEYERVQSTVLALTGQTAIYLDYYGWCVEINELLSACGPALREVANLLQDWLDDEWPDGPPT